MTNENTTAALEIYGDKIREQMVENLKANKSYITGGLAKSITNEVFQNPPTAVVAVNDWYGIVVEEGIGRGAGKMPPIAPIKNWIKRNPNINPKPGVSVESFAWAIAKNISKKGTNPKAKPFAAPAVKQVQEQFGTQLIEDAMGMDIEIATTIAFKESAQ